MAPPSVQQVLREPGQPLDAATRAFFEPRFGHNFSRVRVHADAQAAESAREVDARAYTAGLDIVFARSQYAPQTEGGRRLLAHELAHVVQQGGVTSSGGWELGSPDGPHEHDAQRAAAGIDGPHRIRIPSVPPGAPRIRRDLATPRPDPAPPPQKALTKKQVQDAIRFNSEHLSKEDTLWIQDILGVRPPGTWDENAIRLLAILQEQYGLKKHGMVDKATFEFLKREHALGRAKVEEWRKSGAIPAKEAEKPATPEDPCPCNSLQDHPCGDKKAKFIDPAFELAKQWLPKARTKLEGFAGKPAPGSAVARAMVRHFSVSSAKLASDAVKAIAVLEQQIKLTRCRDACVPNENCGADHVMHASFVGAACYEFCGLFFENKVGSRGRARAVLHEMAHKWLKAGDIAYEGDDDYPPPIESQGAGVNADSLASLIRDLGT